MQSRHSVKALLKAATPFIGLLSLMLLMQILAQSFLGELTLQTLGYERWQFWRWLSAHFVHLNWYHCLLNGAGVMLLAYLLMGYVSSQELIFFLLLGAFFSSFLMLLIKADVGDGYAGLSGVLHGLFLLAADRAVFLEAWRRLGLASFIIVKVLWEQTPYFEARETEELIGGAVATAAHLIGALFGILYILIMKLKKYIFK